MAFYTLRCFVLFRGLALVVFCKSGHGLLDAEVHFLADYRVAVSGLRNPKGGLLFVARRSGGSMAF